MICSSISIQFLMLLRIDTVKSSHTSGSILKLRGSFSIRCVSMSILHVYLSILIRPSGIFLSFCISLSLALAPFPFSLSIDRSSKRAILYLAEWSLEYFRLLACFPQFKMVSRTSATSLFQTRNSTKHAVIFFCSKNLQYSLHHDEILRVSLIISKRRRRR